MLNWIINNNNGKTTHCAVTSETSEPVVKELVEAVATKAIASLNENIQENSLYLLCEWHPTQAQLTISLTDASKTQDAPITFQCVFSGVADALAQADLSTQENYSALIKYWLHDFLSSYSPFFSYSLVAIYHASTRNQTELL